ncbi:MAG: hypothetical protein KDN22_10775 [Verrucomicrobiae bacterium]|nr:hypothetical protein [Verrucomicrobiae bacterium]
MCTLSLHRIPAVSVCLLVALLCWSCSHESEGDNKKKTSKRDALTIDQPDDLDRQIEKLTGGAPTKVVWAWHQGGESTDTYSVGRKHVLAGIDTRDHRGARVILSEEGNYSRPMISPDGEWIVFTDKNVDRNEKTGKKKYEPAIYKVDWNGRKSAELAKGYAVDVWSDPETEIQWVYALRDLDSSAAAAISGTHLFRFKLDDPSQSEIVFDKRSLSPDNFQLSKNGDKAGALLPWPEAGVLDLKSGEVVKTENGCWTSTAPDESGITWVFDGQHRHLRMFTPDGQRSWSVDLSKIDVVNGHEVYHPRWSNHAQYFAITGPYIKAKKGENVISKGGEDAEIILCRFNKDYDGVDRSLRITNNSTGDFFPDLWVSTGDMSYVSLPEPEEPAPEPEKIPWPATEDGLVFKWENGRLENSVPGKDGERRICRVEAKGLARFGSSYSMTIDGGYFVADDASSVAIAEACAASGEVTIEALITERMWGDFSNLSTRILGYTMGEDFAFGVYRVQHSLTAQIRLGADGDSAEYNVPLGPLHIENDRPFQLVLTVRDDNVSLYVDGFFLSDFQQTRKSTHGWKPGSFVIGDPEPINADGWEAEVSGIAIYDRAFYADEVKENYLGVQQRVSQRARPKKVRLVGRLVEATPLPTPESIDTYRRALVDYTYDVVEVKSGTYRNGRIVVLHWAVLDGKPAPGVPRKIGQTYEMLVEAAEGHPQLRSERTESGTSEFDLPLYYDPSTPGAKFKIDY